MNEWQPIETANTRDGTRILAFAPNDNRLSDAIIILERCWGDWTYFAGDDTANDVLPTHWIPLPEPPKNIGQGEPV